MEIIKSYELIELNGDFIRKFQVKADNRITNQQIVNRIVELGYNPIINKWREIKQRGEPYGKKTVESENTT